MLDQLDMKRLQNNDPTLTSLNFDNGNLDFGRRCSLLLEAVKGNTHLTSLDLRRNKLGFAGGEAVAEVLKINAALTSLKLGGNGLNYQGGAAIAEALKVNKALTLLDLQNNNLDYEGGEAVAEALKVNTALTSLDLRYNKLDPRGGAAVAEALKVNTALTSLDIRHNNLGPQGGVAMAEALKVNTALTSLYLGDNNLGLQGGAAIAEALKVNKALTLLNLQNSDLDYEGGEAVAEALKVNTALALLGLSYNKLGPQGGMVMAEALKVNTALTSLDLGGNNLDFEAGEALIKALKMNPVLVSLNLAENPGITLAQQNRVDQLLNRNRQFNHVSNHPEGVDYRKSLLVVLDQIETKQTNPESSVEGIKTKSGYSTVHVAAWYGNIMLLQQLQKLSDERFDLNHIADNGYTLLHCAAVNGHTDTISFLLPYITDINALSTEDRQTALHIAASHGHLAVVKLLVAHGANLHLRDKEGCTPTELAKIKGHVDIVQWLNEQDMPKEVTVSIPATPDPLKEIPVFQARRLLSDTSVTSFATRSKPTPFWTRPFSLAGNLVDVSLAGIKAVGGGIGSFTGGLWDRATNVVGSVTSSIAGHIRSSTVPKVNIIAETPAPPVDSAGSKKENDNTSRNQSSIARPSITPIELAQIAVPLAGKWCEQRQWFGHKPLDTKLAAVHKMQYEEQLQEIEASLGNLQKQPIIKHRVECQLAREAFEHAQLRFKNYFQNKLDPSHTVTTSENAEVSRLMDIAQQTLTVVEALQMEIDDDHPGFVETVQKLAIERDHLSQVLRRMEYSSANKIKKLQQQQAALSEALVAKDISSAEEVSLHAKWDHLDAQINQIRNAQEAAEPVYGALTYLLEKVSEQLEAGCLPQQAMSLQKQLALVKTAITEITSGNKNAEQGLLAQVIAVADRLREEEAAVAYSQYMSEAAVFEVPKRSIALTDFFAVDQTTGPSVASIASCGASIPVVTNHYVVETTVKTPMS